jgi:hypothetical protein
VLDRAQRVDVPIAEALVVALESVTLVGRVDEVDGRRLQVVLHLLRPHDDGAPDQLPAMSKVLFGPEPGALRRMRHGWAF